MSIDPRRWPKRPWRALAAVVVILALSVTGVLVYRVRSNGSPAYLTTPVALADLVQTVSATGTVNPQNTIDVGTQVSGTISEIDVDYNSQVHKGQILARLDPTELQQALDSANAGLAQAQAQAAAAQATAQSDQEAISSAISTVTKDQSALQVAQLTMIRDKTLLARGYIAQSQADTDQSNLVAAQTAVEASQSSVQQARSEAVAGAAQAQAGGAAGGIQQAAVQQAQTNLAHSVITSPVDGTVIARDVSAGTTVAASLQTPTLFAIAQNLSKMEVDLAVGEPDIGSVKNGETVDFTVLAYPNRTFHGVVSQVRKNPVITQNVVTYTTVVLVNNNDQALLPGMTANATIDVQKAANALVVPLAALSFTPAFSSAHQRTQAAGSSASSVTPWGQTTGSASSATVAGSQSRVFVERDGKLVRIPVSVTLVSGTQAAVAPAGDATLAAGDQVVTSGGAATPAHAQRAQSTGNPLTGGGAPGGAMRGIH